ncbi:hypothetical protein CON32_11345 [Bacillus cereus]|nr:hypothetical protein CON32_11345 [Bacillus cereus]
MTFKTYEINVDLVHDTSTTYSNHFSQNDRNSAKLLVTITNKGAELDLSQAKSVRMSFRKPDGTRVFQNDCQPINAMKGKYQIVLKTQTLTSVGNVIAQIHIEEEDRILDTQKFFFVVNDSLASDEAVESTNEFTIIQKAIEAGKKLEGVDINGIIAAGELAKGALPKTGGTMTGNFNFDVSSGEKSLVWRGGTTNIGFISGSTQNWRLRDWANSKDVFSYDGKTFNVLADSNLVTKNKDGVVNLTLTADAELTGANGVIAVRRGNTVSLRAPIRRKAGSGNLAVLFTLPTDMRPVGFTVQQGIVSIDGVSAIFTVSTAGEVTIQNATATDVAGKNFYVTCTYVVD